MTRNDNLFHSPPVDFDLAPSRQPVESATFTKDEQQQYEALMRSSATYPKLGIAANFAADPLQADVDRYLSMTPLGEAALKLRKESTNGKQ